MNLNVFAMACCVSDTTLGWASSVLLKALQNFERLANMMMPLAICWPAYDGGTLTHHAASPGPCTDLQLLPCLQLADH